ncbi:hypothetical protein SAMN02745673_01415 [Marinactinospora thermotolerans DSM 45154]|uniref:Uncharacterized protein n=1 Tax=Marinactinospora thermotolerans DSM 45154 TaxID=1122192 RepID=A0A1T4NEQ5_9ACTN|nr:hypothetical protein SAMN02745673_01415 [Marinactinospora thermotolerans DSM 45154]
MNRTGAPLPYRLIPCRKTGPGFKRTRPGQWPGAPMGSNLPTASGVAAGAPRPSARVPLSKPVPPPRGHPAPWRAAGRPSEATAPNGRRGALPPIFHGAAGDGRTRSARRRRPSYQAGFPYTRASTSRSARRSSARARATRERTVPTGTVVIAATSS